MKIESKDALYRAKVYQWLRANIKPNELIVIMAISCIDPKVGLKELEKRGLQII